MSFVLLNQGEPDRIQAGVVSANFFDMLGVRPLLGRTFRTGDDDIGAEAVLVLSHEYWQAKFGGEAGVIGRVLRMNNRPHTVVGVLPPFPQYPVASDVYMSTSACPFRAGAQTNPQQGHRSFAALRVFGRLADGATVDRATAEVRTVAESFNQAHAGDHEATGSRGLTGRAASLQDELTAESRPLLLALGASTLLILILACANVANLALALSMRRVRELGLRTALGAGRVRLFRQLATESLIVAAAGGLLGLGLAYATQRLLVEFVGRFTPRADQIGIDGGVLLFALAVSVATGLVFGARPAMAADSGLLASLREGSAQAGESRQRQRLRAGLVVAQVAVSFVLLVGAGLMIQSLYRIAAVPLGYRSDNVLTAAYFGNFSRMNTPAEAHRVQARILETLRSTPGVRAAALTNAVPQASVTPGQVIVTIEGRPAADGLRLEADPNVASDGYFDLLEVKRLGGRDFQASDTLDSPRVAIINRTMASFWNGGDPIGGRFTVGPAQNRVTRTVIGVVEDFRLYGASERADRSAVLPSLHAGQRPDRTAARAEPRRRRTDGGRDPHGGPRRGPAAAGRRGADAGSAARRAPDLAGRDDRAARDLRLGGAGDHPRRAGRPRQHVGQPTHARIRTADRARGEPGHGPADGPDPGHVAGRRRHRPRRRRRLLVRPADLAVPVRHAADRSRRVCAGGAGPGGRRAGRHGRSGAQGDGDRSVDDAEGLTRALRLAVEPPARVRAAPTAP